MAMKQNGYVTEVTEQEVKVRVDRESACGGNCAGCHGCPSGAVLVTCPNDLNEPFQIGEAVELEMPSGAFLGNVFLSYGLLTFFMLLGACLGYWLSKRDGGAVLGGFAALGIGAVLLRYGTKRRKTVLSIKRIDNSNSMEKR